MLINIDQSCASVGIFYSHGYVLICKLNKLKLNNIDFFISHFVPIILFLFLLLHGDVESKPGPKKNEQTYFLLCHLNVNSLVAHQKCLCWLHIILSTDMTFVYQRVFLDTTISDDDDIVHMEGYNLIRADHPDNIKRGGVCLYFKKGLALRKIELSHITECLLCEVNIKGQVVSLLLAVILQVKLTLSLMIFYQILRSSLMTFRSFNQPLQSSSVISMLGQNHGCLLTQPLLKVLD